MADIQEIINNARAGVEYGTIHLTLKIDNKHLSTVDTNKYVSYKTIGGNVEALTVIGTLLKNTGIAIKSAPDSTPPTLTFSCFFSRDGECDRLSIQDFKRINERR